MANHLFGRGVALWVSGLWIVPPMAIFSWVLPSTLAPRLMVILLSSLLAPVPALIYLSRQSKILRNANAGAQETVAQLKLQSETVRYRTGRLREELQAANKQARLSHQLTLLGQFTAGFTALHSRPLGPRPPRPTV